jgi:CubicO group peptidase (beta-lactamase class C family)
VSTELGADVFARRLDVTMDRFQRMVLQEYRLPGAIIGALNRGRETYIAAGVAGPGGTEADAADRVFPLFSATKLLTATLVMRLVDQGLVELDAPAADYVAEFRPPDLAVRSMITVRRLLAHTSGLRSGDLDELGTGPLGEGELADYVARSRDLRTILPPGDIYSYSSTGYAVLGRLVETMTGTPWPEALRAGLLDPLGMRGTTPRIGPTSPRPVPGPAAPLDTPPAFCDGPDWLMPVDQAISTPRDLLAFARLHLDDREPALRRLLGDDAVRAMRRPHATIPDPTVGYAGGLGWRLYSTEVELLGHWGAGYGHTMALWLWPARQLAVVVMVSHPDAETFIFDIAGRLFNRLLAQRPRIRAREAGAQDGWRIAGDYEAPGFRFRVEDRADRTIMTCTQLASRNVAFSRLDGMEVGLQPTDSAGDYLVRIPGDQFIVRFRSAERGGRFRYLHLWSQAAVRVE